jgi:hypothetical protein
MDYRQFQDQQFYDARGPSTQQQHRLFAQNIIGKHNLEPMISQIRQTETIPAQDIPIIQKATQELLQQTQKHQTKQEKKKFKQKLFSEAPDDFQKRIQNLSQVFKKHSTDEEKSLLENIYKNLAKSTGLKSSEVNDYIETFIKK